MLVLTALLAGAALAAAPAPTPDRDKGLIDGHPALAMWPVFRESDTLPADPAGFTVHLIPHANRNVEVTKPAGTWFLLDEPGPYRWFLEGPGMISRNERVVVWGFGIGDQGLKTLDLVVPAGRAIVNPDTPVKPRQSVRLYSATSTFFRQVRGADASGPVQMPPGPVLALLHDDEKDAWVAMAKPVEARVDVPGIVTLMPPVAPATDLFVRVVLEGAFLDRPEGISLVLDTGAARRRPDVLFHDPSAVYAGWWGLAERKGTIHFAAPGVLPLTRDVALPGGVLQTVEAPATPGGTLTVALALPPGLESPQMALRVVDAGRTLDERPITDPAAEVAFTNVPAHLVHLVLVSGVWKVTQAVDMSGGGDRTVTLAPSPIRVTGTITRCGKPAAATVGFLANSSAYTWALTTTRDDGRYDVTVFHPITLLKFSVPGTSDSLQPLSRAITEDAVMDFELPCNAYSVHVTDAKSGTPVAGAKVGVLNQGQDAGASVETTTDEAGRAKLHPLRPGSLTITVRADGYQRASVKEDVPKDPVQKQIEVALEPTRRGATLQLRLPDGTPAAAAQVAAVGADGASLLWDGTCDAQGRLDLPDQPGATVLLARDPAQGCTSVPGRRHRARRPPPTCRRSLRCGGCSPGFPVAGRQRGRAWPYG